MVKKICYAVSAFLIVCILEILPIYVDIVWDIVMEILTVFVYAFASFFCARAVLPKGKMKWVFFPLCPLLFSLPYPILYFGNVDTYGYTLKIFAWCLVWSLLGLIRIRPMEYQRKGKACEEQAPKKVSWVWRPIGNSLLLVLGYVGFYVLSALEGIDWEWGGIILGLFHIMLYALVLSPLMTVSYCRRIRGLGWKKYLCCLYNAVILGLYYAVGSIPFNNLPIDFKYVTTAVVSVLGLSVIIPALLCGLVTLIVYDVKEKLSNREKKIVLTA